MEVLLDVAGYLWRRYALGDDWGTASFESHGASDSKDVQLGRGHKDICDRLRSEIDKARKEYDRRFRAIQDHPWITSIAGWWKFLPEEISKPWANTPIPRLHCVTEKVG